MKKIKQIIALYLAVIMCCLPAENTVFASEISENTQEQVSAESEKLQVEGNTPVGNVLASAIASEQNAAEARNRSANNISGLEITGNTVSVEVQTETEADLVVAIYDEQQVQMMASGKTTVSSGGITEISISGKMPEYFIASAYLLDTKTHEALCDAYTTELYTKEIKNLQDSTVKDFDEERVVQLDGNNEKTNFAVYNTGTVVVNEILGYMYLVDNGNGAYTIRNAGSNIRKLKKGDTLSYEKLDGTILLIKVEEISVIGTTVEIVEDPNAELNDYFDYVKIESDSSKGECTVDNSDLEEGITPVNSTENTSEFSERSLSLHEKLSITKTITYTAKKKFENEKLPENKRDNITVEGKLEFGFGAYLEYYITPIHSYYSLELVYSQQVSVDITGKLSRKEIEIGHVREMIIEGVIIGFTPSFIIEASGEIYWSGKVEGKIGGNYDTKRGFSNTSTLPSCQREFKIEGTLYIGLKMSPYVSIFNEKLDKIYMNVEGGVEFYAKAQSDNVSRDVIHECKVCFGGTITGKLSVLMGIDLCNGKIRESTELYSRNKKLADFYWSLDRMEFGWTTCPHLRYPVTVTAKDNNGNSRKGKSILTVIDKNSGNPVEIRTKEQSMNSIEATDSQKTKFYLPNGDYTVNADADTMAGKQDFSVKENGTDVTVKLNMNKDQNIVWYIENNDTLHIGGTGNMPDYAMVAGSGSYDYIETSAPWGTDKILEKINKVIIDKGITSIGHLAFASFKFMKKIEIPESVTSIGSYAFVECTSLDTIDIPQNVSKIGAWAFGNCIKLENIIIPDNVTVINQWTFVGCSSLKTVNIPKNVTQIGQGAFEGCMVLKELTIPEKVTTIGYDAFSGCQNLEMLTIPASVRYIGGDVFCVYEGYNKDQTVIFKGNKPEFDTNTFRSTTSVTVFYPANDSTWNGIESESFGGTDITWIAYNANAFLSIPEEGENEDSDEVSVEIEEESQEEAEFTDDIPFTDDSDDVDYDDNISIEDDTDTDEVDVNEDEETQEAFDDDSEEEVQILETPVSYAQDAGAATGESRMFSGLLPYGSYVFVAVKNEQSGDLLGNSNLLYIKQGNADNAGMLSFRYILKENYSNPVFKIYGKQEKNISNLQITLSGTSYVYDGSAKKPSVKITDGSYILKNGTDYLVSYSQNINAGKAIAEITGKGGYTGKKSINFNIVQANAKLEFKSANITKKYGSASFINFLKTKKTDGKIQYSSSNSNVASVDKNTGKIKITGVGTTVITAEAGTGKNYKAGKAKFTLKVTATKNMTAIKTTGKFGKEKTTIYRIKANGKKKKLIKFSGKIIGDTYVYNNKLFYTRVYGRYAPQSVVVESLNLKNKKRSTIADEMMLTGHSGRYALLMPEDARWVQPLYIMDMKTKKKKWISNNVSEGGSCISGNGKIYYIKFENTQNGTGTTKYTVYTCKKNGTAKKKIKTFSSDRNTVRKMTEKYVVMGGYNKEDKVYYY